MKKSKLLFKLTILLFAFLGLYTIAGFFLAPILIKDYLESKVPSLIDHSCQIEKLSLNPFDFSISIQGIKLSRNETEVINLGDFYLDFAFLSLFEERWTVEEVVLNQPVLNLVLEKDGSINLKNLVPAKTSKKKQSSKSKIPVIQLFEITLKGGEVNFLDRRSQQPVSEKLSGINLQLSDFSTDFSQESQIELEIRSASRVLGDKLSLAGSLGLNPIRSTGKIEANDINLQRLFNYLQPFLQFRVEGGTGELAINYHFQKDDKLTISFSQGSALMKNAKMIKKSGKDPLISFQSLSLAGFEYDVFGKHLEIADARAQGADIRASINSSGKLNLIYLFVKENPPPKKKPVDKSKKPFFWKVDRIGLEETNLTFENGGLPKPQVYQFEDLNLEINNLSGQKGSRVSMALDTTLKSSGRISIKGESVLSPFQTDMNLKLSNIDLKLLQPYVDQINQIGFGNGLLSTDCRLAFLTDTESGSSTEGAKILSLTEGSINIQKLSLGPVKGARDKIKITDLNISEIHFNLSDKDLEIGSIKLKGPAIHATFSENRKIDLVEMLKPKKPSEKPLVFLLKEIVINQGTLGFTHHLLAKPENHTLEDIELKLKNVTLKKDHSFMYDLSSRLKSGGDLSLKGQIGISPLFVSSEISLDQINMTAVQPYLEMKTGIGLRKGALDVSGQFEFQPKQNGKPLFSFQGDLGVSDLKIANQKTKQPIFNSSSIGIKNLSTQGMPLKTRLQELKIAKPQLFYHVSNPKQSNFSGLIASSDASTDKKKQEPKKKKPLDLHVEHLNLQEGAVQIFNKTLKPYFFLELTDLRGDIKQLSMASKKRTPFSIRGKLSHQAPFKIKGHSTISEFKKDTKIKISIKDFNLPTINPYAIKLFGQTIDWGKLKADLQYKISDNDLNGKNKLVLDQLELGPKVKSEGAKELPMGFAVGLFKDSEGKIEVELPIKGDLNKPDFKYGGLVANAVLNAISKALTSPFRLIANLVSSSEEPKGISFKPGDHSLTPKNMRQMNRIVKKLKEKNELKLIIKGTYSEKTDYKPLLSKKPDKISSLFTEANKLDKENRLRFLGRQRAATVYDFISSKGIASSRLYISQEGASKAKSSEFVECRLTLFE